MSRKHNQAYRQNQINRGPEQGDAGMPLATDQWQLVAIVLLHKFAKEGALITHQDVDDCFGWLKAEGKKVWVNEHPGGFDLSFATDADITHAQTSGQIAGLVS